MSDLAADIHAPAGAPSAEAPPTGGGTAPLGAQGDDLLTAPPGALSFADPSALARLVEVQDLVPSDPTPVPAAHVSSPGLSVPDSPTAPSPEAAAQDAARRTSATRSRNRLVWVAVFVWLGVACLLVWGEQIRALFKT